MPKVIQSGQVYYPTVETYKHKVATASSQANKKNPTYQ